MTKKIIFIVFIGLFSLLLGVWLIAPEGGDESLKLADQLKARGAAGTPKQIQTFLKGTKK